MAEFEDKTKTEIKSKTEVESRIRSAFKVHESLSYSLTASLMADPGVSLPQSQPVSRPYSWSHSELRQRGVNIP